MCQIGSSCDEKSCDTCKGKRHKHADLIKAWADGAKIQKQSWNGTAYQWVDDNSPTWEPGRPYRIKPEPKPNTVEFRTVTKGFTGYSSYIQRPDHNIKFIFDGETGFLKSVEKI